MYSLTEFLVLASNLCGFLRNYLSIMSANHNHTSNCMYTAVFNGGLKQHVSH